MKNTIQISFAIFVFLASAGLAENSSVPVFAPFDPFSVTIAAQVNQTQKAAMDNQAARQIADGYVNKSEVEKDTRVPFSGREYAHNASSRDANTGAVVAGITGGLLASAGTGYLLAGNLPLGSALLTMAGMEFAQMAASSSASQQNKNLQNRLEFNYDAPSAGVTLGPDKAPSQRPELPPKLDEFLKQNKMDPETFKEALFSGALSDQEAVLTALGASPDSFSKADLQKGFELAQDEFNKASQEALKTAKVDASFLAGNSGSNSKVSEAKSGEWSQLGTPPSEDPASKSKKGMKNPASLPAVSESFFPSMYDLPSTSFSAQEQALLFESYLRDQGIVMTPSRMNIFQVAQQSYRSFSKTKKKIPSRKNRIAQLD